MTASASDSLPDPVSDAPPTEWEPQLLDAAGVHLDNQVMRTIEAPLLRALRAGHEAGRASVLKAPTRVYRAGDPPPERKITVFDGAGRVTEWDGRGHDSWPDHLRRYGPLVEIDVDYDAALAADEARRAEL